MPRNKEAYIRYKVINRCLKEFRYTSMERLIKACEEALDISPISERTIYKDINDMKKDQRLGFNAPIKFDHFKKGYYYTDPDYSTDNIPLNSEELQGLAFAAGMLQQYKNIPFFDTFSGTVQKIVDGVKISRMLTHTPETNFIDFEKTPVAKGGEYLPALVKSIIDKQVLVITYQAFYQKTPTTHTVHPYFLKEYRNRWYLIALHDHQKSISIYGLDRLQAIENVSNKIYIEPDFNPDEYFRNTIGVFCPPGEPPLIKLRFTKDQAQYILTQPIHQSQQVVEETDDHVTITLKVHPTVEMKMLILGYGMEVQVLEPIELRQQIMESLQKAADSY